MSSIICLTLIYSKVSEGPNAGRKKCDKISKFILVLTIKKRDLRMDPRGAWVIHAEKEREYGTVK